MKRIVNAVKAVFSGLFQDVESQWSPEEWKEWSGRWTDEEWEEWNQWYRRGGGNQWTANEWDEWMAGGWEVYERWGFTPHWTRGPR